MTLVAQLCLSIQVVVAWSFSQGMSIRFDMACSASSNGEDWTQRANVTLPTGLHAYLASAVLYISPGSCSMPVELAGPNGQLLLGCIPKTPAVDCRMNQSEFKRQEERGSHASRH